MKALLALAAGVLFAIGLTLSGMTRPEKVIAFLDFGGAWDPSLAFVMVGAIGVYGALRLVVMQRLAPLFDARFHAPDERTGITPRLVVGAAVFGVGWGLAGYCPGPSVVAAGTGGAAALVFVGAMLVGLRVERLPGASPSSAAPTNEPPRVAHEAGSG